MKTIPLLSFDLGIDSTFRFCDPTPDEIQNALIEMGYPNLTNENLLLKQLSGEIKWEEVIIKAKTMAYINFISK